MSRGEERRRFSQTEQAEAHNSFAEEEEAETAEAIVCGFPPIPLRTHGWLRIASRADILALLGVNRDV